MASRQPQASGKKPVPKIHALHRRVQTVEAAAFAANLSVAASVSPALHASPPEESRSLVFSLDSKSPQKTRVTLDHTEVVLFGSWSTPSKPRKKGAWISVLIEVIGSPGDTSTVTITNSDPDSLTSAPIPGGQTHIADPRVIEVDWK